MKNKILIAGILLIIIASIFKLNQVSHYIHSTLYLLGTLVIAYCIIMFFKTKEKDSGSS